MPATAMVSTNEVEEFVQELESAIVKAAGRIEKSSLRIAKVTVEIKAALVKTVGGEFDIKIVTVGGTISSEQTRTVTVTFVPAATKGLLDAEIDEELVNSLAIIQAAVSGIGKELTLSSADVEIGVTRTLEGKLKVFFGGEISKEKSHTATLEFEPATGK